jgi:hypothetical protein
MFAWISIQYVPGYKTGQQQSGKFIVNVRPFCVNPPRMYLLQANVPGKPPLS